MDEQLATGDRQSLLGTVGLSKVFRDHGLTLSASREQSLDGEGETATTAPERTILGADKSLGERVVLNFRHEITEQSDTTSANTSVGATVQPWSGAQIASNLSQLTQDSASRLAATVGVDQSFRISDAWSASFGMANRSWLDGEDIAGTSLNDHADSPFDGLSGGSLFRDEEFMSAYLGAGYRRASTAGSARLEQRWTDTTSRSTIALGGARELSEALSYAGGTRLQWDEDDLLGARDSISARLGLSWRPDDESYVLFNRLDFDKEGSELTGESWKLVNNASMNVMATEATQVAIFNGLKYSEASYLGTAHAGWTYLLGGEVRHDITPRLDLGLRASVLHSGAADSTLYQVGPSIGYSPAEDVWFSVGYNLLGFEDDDFADASDSRHGLFLKLRFKFDQGDLSSLLDWVSPNRSESVP